MPAPQEGETIATFGDARMVRDLGGRLEIVGGTEEDRREAREWASRFLYQANPDGPEGLIMAAESAEHMQPVCPRCKAGQSTERKLSVALSPTRGKMQTKSETVWDCLRHHLKYADQRPALRGPEPAPGRCEVIQGASASSRPISAATP
jgi:hypothetical protein